MSDKDEEFPRSNFFKELLKLYDNREDLNTAIRDLEDFVVKVQSQSSATSAKQALQFHFNPSILKGLGQALLALHKTHKTAIIPDQVLRVRERLPVHSDEALVKLLELLSIIGDDSDTKH